MWQIIRETQGLSPNKNEVLELNEEDRYQFNQQRLLLHEVRPFIPKINALNYSEPLRSLKLTKLRRWLLDENSDLRLQALNEVVKFFNERRENCVESLQYDFLTILISMVCCSSEVILIRLRAATALEILLKERSAQVTLLQMENTNTFIENELPCECLLNVLRVSKLTIETTASKEVTNLHHGDHNNSLNGDATSITTTMTDNNNNNTNSNHNNNVMEFKEREYDLFVMVMRVIIACHSQFNNYELTEVFVNRKAMTILLNLLQTFKNFNEEADCENIEILLATICATFIPLFDVKESVLEFVKLNGVESVSSLLCRNTLPKSDETNEMVLEKLYTETNEHNESNDEASSASSMLVAHVAEVLGKAGEYTVGRLASFQVHTCELLLPYISHINLTVRVEVHAALAQLTILRENKMLIISQSQYMSLINKVFEREDERDVLMFFVKIIVNLAELPSGRDILRQMCLERLYVIKSLSSEDEALQTIVTVAIKSLTKTH